MAVLKIRKQDGTWAIVGDQSAIKYTQQNLTNEQKRIARENINSFPIIDVGELPTENIQNDSFYRLLTGTFYYNGVVQPHLICFIVRELPEIGEPATNTALNELRLYYNVLTKELKGYVNQDISSTLSAPVGWYAAETLFAATEYKFGGIVNDVEAEVEENSMYLVLEGKLYQYQGDIWKPLNDIGWHGTNAGAERFNSTRNVASGDSSHAEGFLTTSGGNYSHAENYGTSALGIHSHSEGFNTTAGSDSQHVQGRYNAIDYNSVYADIVGNGNGDSSRKNIYTLDWNGNGWFQGDVYIGSTSGVNRDSGSKKLATEEYINSKTNTLSTNLYAGLEATNTETSIKGIATNVAHNITQTEAVLTKKGTYTDSLDFILQENGTWTQSPIGNYYGTTIKTIDGIDLSSWILKGIEINNNEYQQNLISGEYEFVRRTTNQIFGEWKRFDRGWIQEQINQTILNGAW